VRKSPVERLADAVGIVPKYLDQTGKEWRKTSAESRTALLAAMGIDAGDEFAAESAVRALRAAERAEMIPAVRVIAVDDDTATRHVAARLASPPNGEARWALRLTLESGEMVEAAMVGSDGVVGASAALDGRISLSRGIVQLPGDIVVCSLAGLKAAAMKSQSLLSLLIRHEQTVYSQAQQSAACFATHHIHARLCRWLLRARDLSDTDTLNFTQEYLAEMLGVKRTSVTLVAHTLQAAGLIKYSRGKIQILDMEALQEGARECYETVKRQYGRLLGNAIN